MSNFRDILVQIIDVIGLPAWRDQDIDDFLGIAEVEAMADLLEPLPKDKQGPIIKKMIGLRSWRRPLPSSSVRRKSTSRSKAYRVQGLRT